MKNYEKIRLSETMKVFEQEQEDFATNGLSIAQDETHGTGSVLHLAMSTNEKAEQLHFLVKAHTYISGVINVYQDLYLKAKELDDEIVSAITNNI